MNQSIVNKDEMKLADAFYESDAKMQYYWQNMGKNYADFMWEVWHIKSNRLWQGQPDYKNEEAWLTDVIKTYSIAHDMSAARSTLYQIWGAIGIMKGRGMSDEKIRFIIAMKNPAILYGITNHWKLDGRYSRGETPQIRPEVIKMIEGEGKTVE